MHEELVYHPHHKVIQAYADKMSQDYPKLKVFFEKIKKCLIMQKPKGFFGMIIDKAHDNKDPETVV